MNTVNAYNIAKEEMGKHGLDGWKFKWSAGKRLFGFCNYRTKTISLSYPLTKLNDQSDVTDTIRHEIAHALAGQKDGHGKNWQFLALSVGAIPKRCYGAGIIQPKRKWRATCPKCGKTVLRYRKIKSLACKACCIKYNHGKWNADFKFTWKGGGEND